MHAHTHTHKELTLKRIHFSFGYRNLLNCLTFLQTALVCPPELYGLICVGGKLHSTQLHRRCCSVIMLWSNGSSQKAALLASDEHLQHLRAEAVKNSFKERNYYQLCQINYYISYKFKGNRMTLESLSNIFSNSKYFQNGKKISEIILRNIFVKISQT